MRWRMAHCWSWGRPVLAIGLDTPEDREKLDGSYPLDQIVVDDAEEGAHDKAYNFVAKRKAMVILMTDAYVMEMDDAREMPTLVQLVREMKDAGYQFQLWDRAESPVFDGPCVNVNGAVQNTYEAPAYKRVTGNLIVVIAEES